MSCHQSTMNIATLWATTYHMTAPCCHGCLMVSHNREGVNPWGLNFYPSPCLLSLSMHEPLSLMYTAMKFLSSLSLWWLTVYMYIVQCISTFVQPLFLFQLYIFWLHIVDISVARSGQWLLNDNYYPIRIWVYLFFLLYNVGKIFLDFFLKKGLTFSPILV